MKKDKCILCGSEIFVILFIVEDKHIEKCVECHLLRTREDPEIFYDEYHRDKDYKNFESHFKNIFAKRVAIIEKLYPSGGRVLDIGASTGVMLELFKKKGWATHGVEPSQSYQVAKEKDLDVQHTTFEAVKLPKNYFNVVVMNHTFEHLEDPLLSLKKTYSILKKGGILLIDVPNAGGLSARLMKGAWPYWLPREHKHHFTKETLEAFFEKAQFTVIHQESRSGIFDYKSPIAEIAEALLTRKKRLFSDLLGFPGAAISTILNMGSGITVVGKK